MSKNIDLLKQIQQKLHIQPQAQVEENKPSIEPKVVANKEAFMPNQKDYLRIIIIAMAIVLFLNVLVTIKLFSIAYSTNSVQTDSMKDLKQMRIIINDFTRQSAAQSDDILKIKNDTKSLISAVKNNDTTVSMLNKKVQMQDDVIQKLIQNNNVFIKDMDVLKGDSK